MFIIPISSQITPLNPISPVSSKENETNEITSAEPSFLDVFKSVVDNAVETTQQKDRDMINVMLGDIDDLHTINANIAKAATAVELLTTVKNQAINAYSEIIRMSI